MPVNFQTLLIDPASFTFQGTRLELPQVNVGELTVFQRALTAEKITETELSETLASLIETVKMGSTDTEYSSLYTPLDLRQIAKCLAKLQLKSPEQYERIVIRTMTLGGTTRFASREEVVATLRKVLKQRKSIDAAEDAATMRTVLERVKYFQSSSGGALYNNYVYLSASGEVRKVVERVISHRNDDPTTEMVEKQYLGEIDSSDRISIFNAVFDDDDPNFQGRRGYKRKFTIKEQQKIDELRKKIFQPQEKPMKEQRH